MKPHPILLIASLALSAGAATANSSPEAPAAPSRAEVVADLHLWRRAGLSEFSTVEAQQLAARRYQAALSRYQALRDSPEHRALVRQLQGAPAPLALRG